MTETPAEVVAYLKDIKRILKDPERGTVRENPDLKVLNRVQGNWLVDQLEVAWKMKGLTPSVKN